MPQIKKQESPNISFSRRLNEALDESPLGVPEKGEGRQTYVAKLFGVGQKAARKWLEAEGYPKMETCIEIATRLSISVEWLLTGNGEKRVISNTDAQLAELLNIWFRMPDAVQKEILSYSKFLLDKLQSQPVVPSSPEEDKDRPTKSH